MRLQLGSYILAGVVTSILAPLLIARADTRAARHTGTPPTVESALAAEEELARAMRENDADGIARMLSDDWAVTLNDVRCPCMNPETPIYLARSCSSRFAASQSIGRSLPSS